MTLHRSFFHIARLVLETETPLSIGYGQGNGLVDNLIVRDANGLPTIPGSSFAGVLRHLHLRTIGVEATENLFGSGGGSDEGHDDQGASRVHVSWGCIHDSNNRPVEGLLTGEGRACLDADPLLSDAHDVPIRRDRVRIDARGTAADQAQFNRVALRAGHRFSIELSLWSTNADHIAWNNLLRLLARPDFRLGGSTRGGFGAIRVVRLNKAAFDLRDDHDFAAFQNLSPDLGNVAGLEKARPPAAQDPPLEVSVSLKSEDVVRFGQGDRSLLKDEEHPAEMLPLVERRIVWIADEDGKETGRLTEKEELLCPASAIKGALRHRFAYHYNILSGDGHFAEDLDKLPATEENGGIRELFGFATDHDQGKGQAGRIIMDDLYLTPQTVSRIPHNGIDRFTGGVRNHVLFSEEVTGNLAFTLRLSILDPGLVSTKARGALARTLDDLCNGRLGLGAGGARGHGYFSGSVEWSDGGTWKNGGQHEA